jgi:hypothetical protein
LDGFELLADILEYLNNNPDAGVFDSYEATAKKHRTNVACVERSLRTLITRFYKDHADVHCVFAPSYDKGTLANKSFIYKLNMLLYEDSGYFRDGRTWYLCCIGDRWEVKIFYEGGQYTAMRGTHEECINYIERELKGYVV